MQLDGWIYGDASSQRHPATLNCSSDGILSWNQDEQYAYAVDQVSFSARIGNTPRFINFPNQFRFETNENNAIDSLLKTYAQQGYLKLSPIEKWVHKIEASKRFIISSMILVILLCWLMIQYGIPYFSKSLAYALPVELATNIGSGSLDLLDNSLMSPSKLSDTRTQALQTMFKDLLPNEQEGFPFDLIFRQSDIVGANAFALPSGTIIFTDEMIELAENDDELKTIMLHEIGHVINRHSLRHIIQQSGLALVVILITGDVSTSSAIILAIPGLLLEASYSQDIEYEADTYALEHLEKQNIAPKHFIAIMERLEASHRLDPDESENSTVENEKKISDYFSSHPPTDKRLERFRD